MTVYLQLDEHFKTTIARDLCGMLIGDCLGYGTHRAIYDHATDPGLIVKVEPHANSFSNIYEEQVWRAVESTKLAQWFAPVVSISASGTILIMRRCEKVRADELPDKVPAFFTDIKTENWGRYEGRCVCLDYGSHLMLEHGMTKRMRSAVWGNG